MDAFVKERATKAAKFIIEHNATLREAEKALGISRSTINRDVAIRLPKINPYLAERVNAILQTNKPANRANITKIHKAFLLKRRERIVQQKYFMQKSF